ncbi:MAG: SixA phosphatase family protein [Bacteroidia bacterium]
MLTVHLVRHAKSSWDFSDVADIDRPLNARGLRDAADMAQRWKENKIFPDLIISSSANRAITTALIFARAIGYSENTIRIAAELYEAPEKNYRALLAQLPNTIKQVAVFGHNPTLTYLVNTLGDAPLDNLPTTGSATLVFDTANWQDLATVSGNLKLLDFPKSKDV